MIIQKLKKLGLNDNEAKVYLASLELGESSVQDLAKKTGVNRVTTHVAVEKLKEDGLVREEKKGKRRQIIAEMPNKIIEILLKKKVKLDSQTDEFRKLLPELESFYNYSETKPKIRFFENLDGLQAIYNDTLDTGEEIFAFTAYHRAEKKLTKWLNDYYIPARIKKNIKAKVIAPVSSFSKNYSEEDKKHKRETLLIPQAKFPFSIEINIYGSKVAIISFAPKEMMGVIIESREVAKTFKLIYQLAWEGAEKYQ